MILAIIIGAAIVGPILGIIQVKAYKDLIEKATGEKKNNDK